MHAETDQTKFFSKYLNYVEKLRNEAIMTISDISILLETFF